VGRERNFTKTHTTHLKKKKKKNKQKCIDKKPTLGYLLFHILKMYFSLDCSPKKAGLQKQRAFK